MSEIIRFFIPKNKLFFSHFDKQSDNIHSMCLLLKNMIKNNNTFKKEQHIDRIAQLHRDNAELTHTLLLELSNNLITPFDREDIHQLTTSLRQISYRMDSLARQLASLQHIDKTIGLPSYGTTLFRSLNAVGKAIHMLNDLKKKKEIISYCLEVYDAYKRSQDTYDQSLIETFEDEVSIEQLLDNLDVYTSMNDLHKRCKEVAFLLEGILIKYG